VEQIDPVVLRPVVKTDCRSATMDGGSAPGSAVQFAKLVMLGLVADGVAPAGFAVGIVVLLVVPEGGAMTPPDLARTLDAVANQLQVVAGLTTELRRAVTADAQTVIDLDGAVDRVVQLLRDLQPTHTEGV